jgi:hypothetical protein
VPNDQLEIGGAQNFFEFLFPYEIAIEIGNK